MPGSGYESPLSDRLEAQMPGLMSEGCYIDTTDVAIEEPPPEEPPQKGGKKGEPVEPPPKPPGEPINVSGIQCFVNAPPSPPPAEIVEGEAQESAEPRTEVPLLFPLPLTSSDDPLGSDALLQLRDWLQAGVRVKVLYRKKPEPVDPDAAGPPTGDAEAADAGGPPPEVEPRLIGGGILSVSSALRPLVSPLSEELRQEGRLPPLPPTYSIGPKAMTLAPYSMWLEPDVQVPNAPAAKSLSDISASLTMDVVLYAKEPETQEDGQGG